MTVEAPKVFFSYARADTEFVLRLAKDLRSAGTNLWVDQLDIRAGDRWDGAVEEALKACPYLLVILSPASVASQNVMDEVSVGLEANKRIVPVRYRDSEIPFRLKRLQYIDFTVDYDKGFTQLLKALNVVQPGRTSLPSENERKVSQEIRNRTEEIPAEMGTGRGEKGDPRHSTVTLIPPPGSDLKAAPHNGFLRSLRGNLVSVAAVVAAITSLVVVLHKETPQEQSKASQQEQTSGKEQLPGRSIPSDAAVHETPNKGKALNKDEPMRRVIQGEEKTGPLSSQASDPAAKVYMHTSENRDRAVLEEIGNALRVKGYEVPDTRITPARTAGDVRFFFPQDRDEAGRLKSAVESELRNRGYHISLELLERDGSKFQYAVPGKIEIWLPPLTKPASAAH